MDKKDLYIEKLNAQLKEWSASIDMLKVKADKATADLKIAYYKQLEEQDRRAQDRRRRRLGTRDNGD